MAEDTLYRLEVNCETGEQTNVPLTDEEIAALEQMRQDAEAKRTAAEEEAARVAALKESAKAKLIAGTPLTEDEASVLVL
jgi:hypothetical protein